MRSALLSAAIVTLSATLSGAFTVTVDPATTSQLFDDYNDGVDTAGGFNNMGAGGEAGGFVSVNMPAGASDPQWQSPTPGAPFNISTHPYFRVNSRGSVGGGSQVFPLPASAATVVPYTIGATFSEVQLAFSANAPLANGSGLRIDPLGGGGASASIFDYDYVYLDRVRTIGLAEFDHDGALDGWTINAGLAGGSSSAATSTFSATTSGVDPILQRAGLNIDTNIFDTIEVSIAFDPLSTSRFEIFWGTSTFPGPVGGQSVVLVPELIRDGALHTYRIDMSDEPAWDGNLNLLRVDPLADADAAAGRNIEIDYIRLLEGAAIPEPSAAVLAVLGAAVGLRRRR